MAYCTNCGQSVDKGDSFCFGCGAALLSPDETGLDKPKKGIEKARRNERTGWWLMVSAVILEGIGVWLLLAYPATRTELHGTIYRQVTYRPYRDAGEAFVCLGMLLVLVGGGLCIHGLFRQSKLGREVKQL